MSDTEIMRVPLNSTVDGFLSQECPECERTFKVTPGKGSAEPATHCPYCNHEGKDCWWTKAQAKYLGAYGATKALGPMLEKMARGASRGTRSGGISITVKKPPPLLAPPEEDDMYARVIFECCGETILHDEGSQILHCIICGTPKTV